VLFVGKPAHRAVAAREAPPLAGPPVPGWPAGGRVLVTTPRLRAPPTRALLRRSKQDRLQPQHPRRGPTSASLKPRPAAPSSSRRPATAKLADYLQDRRGVRLLHRRRPGTTPGNITWTTTTSAAPWPRPPPLGSAVSPSRPSGGEAGWRGWRTTGPALAETRRPGGPIPARAWEPGRPAPGQALRLAPTPRDANAPRRPGAGPWRTGPADPRPAQRPGPGRGPWLIGATPRRQPSTSSAPSPAGPATSLAGLQSGRGPGRHRTGGVRRRPGTRHPWPPWSAGRSPPTWKGPHYPPPFDHFRVEWERVAWETRRPARGRSAGPGHPCLRWRPARAAGRADRRAGRTANEAVLARPDLAPGQAALGPRPGPGRPSRRGRPPFTNGRWPTRPFDPGPARGPVPGPGRGRPGTLSKAGWSRSAACLARAAPHGRRSRAVVWREAPAGAAGAGVPVHDRQGRGGQPAPLPGLGGRPGGRGRRRRYRLDRPHPGGWPPGLGARRLRLRLV